MRYALVGAGSVGKSFLANLPHLTRELALVAGGSFRLASRIANTLGAGVAVRSMDALNVCKCILICASGSTASNVISMLSQAEIFWPGKTLLLCDSNLFSDSLHGFRQRGALTGSLNPLGGSGDRFVAEGDVAAVRVAKHLAHQSKAAAVELDREKVWSYGAALTFSSSLFTPLLDTCIQCLKEAGISGAAAGSIADALFQRTLRNYLHAGAKSWSGALATGDDQAIRKEIAALRKSKPEMAEYFRMSAIYAVELFGARPELAAALQPGSTLSGLTVVRGPGCAPVPDARGDLNCK